MTEEYNVKGNDLYYHIRLTRKAQGLFTFDQINLDNHPLVGEPFIHYLEDGTPKQVVIEKVLVEYWNYHFMVKILFVDANRSHGIQYIYKWKTFYTNNQDIINHAMTITDIKDINIIDSMN